MPPEPRARISALPSGINSNPSIVSRSASGFGKGGYRGVAGAVEHHQHRALGGSAGRTRPIVQRRQQLARFRVAGAAFDRERTLADGRQHDFARQNFGREMREPDPL